MFANPNQPNLNSDGIDLQPSELMELLATLKYSDERYRIAAANSSEIILDYNLLNDSIYHVTTRVTEIYGIPQYIEHAPDTLSQNGAIQPESVKDFQDVFQRLKEGEPKIHCTIKTRTILGEIRWAQIILTSISDDKGTPCRAIGVMKDITAQHIAELQYEKELLHRDAMVKDALLYYEADLTNHLILSGIQSMLHSMGLPYSENYEYCLELIFQQFVYPEDRPLLRQVYSAESLLAQHALGQDKIETEYRRLAADGTVSWVRGTAYMTEDTEHHSVRAYYYVHDINDSKLRELKFQQQAERDLLTGLYNKGTAELFTRAAIDLDLASERLSAYFIVDLDNFKEVNDNLGHAYGDALLSETAQKLQDMCYTGDIAGRIGGDEFALFLRDLAEPAQAERIAAKICSIFHSGTKTALQTHKVTCTVGIALLPADGLSFDTLYTRADLALYEAKRKGKDTWCRYRSDLDTADRVPLPRASIDQSSNKTFAGNIMEYVFRILYESQELRVAIDSVLELVSRHFHFDRGYVFEASGDGLCLCQYEWFSLDTEPLPRTLRVISIEDTPLFQIYVGSDKPFADSTSRAIRGTVCSQTIIQPAPQCIQFALHANHTLQGFLGFDRRNSLPALDAAEINALLGVAQMLDVFLSGKYATERLAASSTMLLAVTEGLDNCTYVVDPDSYLLQFVNQTTMQAIPAARVGTLCYEAIRGRTAPCEDCPFAQMAKAGTRYYQKEMYLEPHQLWLKVNASLVTLSDGRDYGLFHASDFTEYRKEDGQYLVDLDSFTRDTSLYDALALSTDDYIFICDVPKDLFYLPKPMVTEFALPGQVLEHFIPLWASLIHENEREHFLQELEDMFSGKTASHNQEYRVKNQAGNWLWVRCRGHLEHDENGEPLLFAGVLTNMGKKHKIDYVSGLPDKYEFELHTRSLLSTQETGGALLLLGLDNFKHLNTLYTWEFGDQVLRAAGQCIQNLLPSSCPLYRLDGDLFGAFFPESTNEDVEAVYDAIFHAFQHQQLCDDKKYYITISGGCTSFEPNQPLSFNTLFKQAECALEYAKGEGKNCLRFYDRDQMSGKEHMLSLTQYLHDSVEHNFSGFEMYLQPQVNPTTRAIRSAEALLRWQCPELGKIPPLQFIPILEQTGLIHKVGRWVLEQAARQAKEWQTLLPGFSISVNLSFVQLQDKAFLSYLKEQVRTGAIDPSIIHLELTESCIATGSKMLVPAFQFLRDLGFQLEMDDFGTGYSSLEILKNAPADVVKIDHAFVRDITHSDFDATFIRFVVSLCHSVGIRVCLEGVETWTEFDLVQPMSLDLIQGFLFGRPMPAKDFRAQFLPAE